MLVHLSMRQNSPLTEEDAREKLERYCVYQERCVHEARRKLQEMRLAPEAISRITGHLQDSGFINEERFATAFVAGKFRIKKWGKFRLHRELKQRQIPGSIIKQALAQIADQDYMDTFNQLAEKQADTLKNLDRIKARKKLNDYLLYRGWEADLVYAKSKELFS